MRRLILSLAIAGLPFCAAAQTPSPVIQDIVDAHILPRFSQFDRAAQQFSETAQSDCNPASEALRQSYGTVMDGWMSVSHLRFGPTEVDNRAFALAFWPDSRGATPRTLGALIAARDPVALSPAGYAEVSIAARGLYAMEFLLFDAALSMDAEPAYFCTLLQTVASDIAATSATILDEWRTDYAQRLLAPSAQGTYRSGEEVVQELFKSLSTGLEFTSENRLGRPLGTFDQPKPKRAESWRSNRSALQVSASLEALRDLALRLSAGNPPLRDTLAAAFDKATAQLGTLDDPAFAGVATPQGRLKVEIIQQSVDAIRALVRDELGPALGVAAGFNALDGD